MDIKEIQVVDLKVTSIDQLIILYKQGFKLSETPYTDSNGNTIVKMSNGTGLVLSLTVVGILWFMLWAFIIYIVGRTEAKIIGLD